MTERRLVQILVTVVALCGAVAHLYWPEAKIDAVTLALIILAALPWVAVLFEEIELPGGWKFKVAELRESEQRAVQVGLLDEGAPPIVPGHEYSFQMVADEDPNLALAGLRIEIERKLNELVESTGLRSGSTSPRVNVGRALKVLGNAGILTHDQSSVLLDIIGILNSAVHGAKVDQQSARRALDVGSRLLTSLDKKRSSP